MTVTVQKHHADCGGDQSGYGQAVQDGRYTSDFGPKVRPIAAMKARVHIRQGRLSDALAWARSRDLSVEDELSYVREFEHITLARLLLAQGSTVEALVLLERLVLAAEHGGRIASVIEILLLQALAHQQHGRPPAAVAPLERALTLAEPEGYVRVVVDEGPRMAELLHAAVKRGIAPAYVRLLLQRFGAAEQEPHPRLLRSNR
jgi:LuxR family maltose regulon positive regulatory protein